MGASISVVSLGVALRIEIVDEFSKLQSLASHWQELADRCGGMFRSPSWLFPWWHAYRRILNAKLFVLIGRNSEGELVCAAPLYRRKAKLAPGLNAREIRLMGDAGPRPPTLDILVAEGLEDACGEAIADTLLADDSWDLIDLEPLAEPSRVRAFAINRLASHGLHVESGKTSGARRVALDVAGVSARDLELESSVRVYEGDPLGMRKGLSVLRRLSRIEWTANEENSPLADEQAQHLLEEFAVGSAQENRARFSLFDNSAGVAVAASLVIDDEDVAVVLAVSVDPETRVANAGGRLLATEAVAAAARGCRALDVINGAVEHNLPPLPVLPRRSLRVSVYSRSSTAKLARTYSAVRRRVEAARVAPGAAAAGARAAWAKIRTAAAEVTSRQCLHLYRAQVWTRGIAIPQGLALRVLRESHFIGMSEREQADICELLEVERGLACQKWRRAMIAVYAEIHQRPAGIVWCARSSLEVPELKRTLRISAHEAYVHDVFVAPSARGRAVAPSMLEFLAKELRQEDVYRCWALIGSDNHASMRAFEKASYMAVANVIYTPGKYNRMKVRPRDPEALELLGLG